MTPRFTPSGWAIVGLSWGVVVLNLITTIEVNDHRVLVIWITNILLATIITFAQLTIRNLSQ